MRGLGGIIADRLAIKLGHWASVAVSNDDSVLRSLLQTAAAIDHPHINLKKVE